MIEVSQIDFKMQFKNLVRRVKYLQSIDRDRDCTNEEIAKRLGYTLPHFNTLVGTGGRVTQDHIRTIEDAYSGILTKNKKEKSVTLYLLDHEQGCQIQRRINKLLIKWR